MQMKGFYAKGPYFEFGPSVRIKKAFQMPMNCSFPCLVKYYLILVKLFQHLFFLCYTFNPIIQSRSSKFGLKLKDSLAPQNQKGYFAFEMYTL